MRSAPSPLSLEPGFFAQLTNFRFDSQDVYVRNGCAQVQANGPGPHRGVYHGSLNGTLTCFAACDVGGAVRLYTVNLGSGVYTEITATSGANGNTRMTTGKNVSFAVAKDLFGAEFLVAQNGTDYARVYDATNGCSIHNPVGLYRPSVSSVFANLDSTAYAYQGYGSNVNFAAPVNSNVGHFGLAALGTGIYGAASNAITINNNVADGDTIVLSLLAGHNGPAFNDFDQLSIWFSGSSLMWNSMQVEVGSGGTFYTLWDPRNGLNGPAFVTPVDPANITTYAAVFNGTAGNLPSSGNMQQVRLTWRGAAPSASVVLEVLAIQATAGILSLTSIQGGSSFAYSAYNIVTRGESPSHVISSTTTMAGTNLIGIAVTWTIPMSPLLNYIFQLQIALPSATDIGNGVSAANIYYLAEGSTQWAYLETAGPFFTYTGSWPTGSAGQLTNFSVGNPQGANPAIPPPDGYMQTIPKGSCCLSQNQRLYVGGVGAAGNQVWISDANRQTRFESQVRYYGPNVPDQSSATIVQFPGETVSNLAQLGGRYVGINPVVVFTKTRTWRLDGLNVSTISVPTLVARHGLPYSNAFAEHHGSLYWLDQELQIVSLKGGDVRALTRKKVDDKLAIATLSGATMAVAYDRIYFGYQPYGAGVNTNVLVYETIRDEWCEDNYTVQDIGILLTVDDGAFRKVYAFATAGAYASSQLEVAGQTKDWGTTAIPCNFTSPMLHSDMWKAVECGPVGIVCDPGVYPQVLTIVRTWKGQDADAIGVDGTIDISMVNGRNVAWLFEKDTVNDAVVGGSGIAVQISVTGNLAGASHVYALNVQLHDVGEERANPGG